MIEFGCRYRKPNSQWFKQRSVYFSHVTEVQRWEVLDRLSECLPYNLWGVGLCLLWLMVIRWLLQLQTSWPCSREEQRRKDDSGFCYPCYQERQRFPKTNPPAPSKCRYFFHWPTLSQMAAKKPGRWSEHIVTPNKNKVLFTRKERGIGFVSATSRAWHAKKWDFSWSRPPAEEGPAVCVFVLCCLQKCPLSH